MSTFTKLKAYLGLSIDELLVQDAALANELTPELTKRGVPIGDPLEPTGYIKDPIGEIPMVRQLIEEGRLEEVLDLAAITGTARTDVQAYISPEAIDDAVLQTLVSKGMANEATALGTMLERYFVCEDSVPIAQAFNTISAANPNSTMANRMRPFWQVSLAPYAGTFPAGTSLEAVAEVIVRRLEVLYPVPAVMGRLAPVIESQQKGALDALVILEARNPRRFDGRFADLDTKDAPSSSLPTLETHWNALMKMVRAYPGMGLETVFDNVALSTGQRFTEMNARIGAFVTAISYAAGPSWRADALALDLTPSSGEWTRFNMANYKEPLKATIRAYQRMRVIGGNIDVAVQLMAAGYSSATKLAQARLDAIQALPGLSGAKGEQIWNDARRLASDAAMFVAGVSDTIGGAFDPAPTQPAPSVGQTLATLEGFASLFGSQSYCDCAHCASILGPAAYFVDLMHFVKQEIGAVIPENDPASLRMRRPDLWTFPLTCAATTALVPTLTIVNEALENAVASGAPDFADRAAIEATVYQSTSGLPGATRSFAQPFAAGLAHAAALLEGFVIDRVTLAAAVGATEPRRVLGVSSASAELITVPRLTLAGQGQFYGVTFVAPNDTAPVEDVDAEILAPAMGLDREGLGQVVTSWFVRQGGAAPHIEATRRNAQSVQDDIEHVRDLTVALLDRMHRLVRASRVLGMTVVQLDRLLKVMGDGALSSLEAFTRLRVLASKAGAPISDDDAAVLAGLLDDLGLARWNRGVRGPAEAWPNSGTAFAHPGLVTEVVAGSRAAAARMESALGLKAPATLALIRFLAPHLAGPSGVTFDPEAVDPLQRRFVLSLANLTLLDRHARLARLLGLAIEELAQLMPLAGLSVVAGLADAVAVADARDAWRASGRTFEQLVLATGGTPTRAGALPAVATIAAAVRTRYAAVRTVPDEVFATTLGVSDADATTIFAANATRFVTVAGTRIVAPGAVVDDTTVTAPAGITVAIDGGVRSLTSADVARALAPHTAIGVLVPALAAATGRSDAEVAALAALTGIGLTGIVGKSIADPVDGPELEQLIEAVARVDVATRGWTAAGLVALAQTPNAFGPGPWPTIDDAHPERPTFTFAQATALGRAAVRGTASDRQDLFLAAVANFTGAPPAFTADADVALAALLGTSPATIASIRGRVALAPGAIAALDQLAVIVRLADRLGVDGDVLRDLVSDDDAERAVAAAAVEHAAALRGERDAAEAKRLDDVRAALREQKRDALVDYLVRSPGPSIPRTRLALSAHLLMDVDAGGCATTSRVVAATNAVQEYVTRVTLGLEATSTGARITLSDAGTRSWEWRRAYRVWEANRKVFLWPENYLEPSVRDDKTPLFTALEDALGQGDLEEASILAAYATYIQGLEELASLKIAGAYHDVGVGTGAGTDVLHLIGVTPSDPATFYYRSVTNLAASLGTAPKTARWGHWHKLDISAPTRFVSPVVYQGRLSLLWPTIKTRAKQSLASGQAAIAGYRHTFGLVAQSIMPNGAWGQPQAMALPRVAPAVFPEGGGVVIETLSSVGVPLFQVGDLVHTEPVDGYTLSGPTWERVAPVVGSRLLVAMRDWDFVGDVDLRSGAVMSTALPVLDARAQWVVRQWTSPVYGKVLGAVRPTVSWTLPHPAVVRNAAATEATLEMYGRDVSTLLAPAFASAVVVPFAKGYAGSAEVLPVMGSERATVVHLGEPLLLTRVVDDGDRCALRRIGSSAVKGLGQTLFEAGIDGLLATAHQLALNEAPLPFVPEIMVLNQTDVGTLNFRGSFGAYLRELFFHIPLLIATSLSGRGRHADARRWFHRVFDPTSTEVVDTTGTPTGDVAHRQLDRVWRCRELRGLGIDGARGILSDGAALEAYREDPFNPHAIARCRLTAYQRHVFARYIDNLLDWGDLLFAQFQREPVEEARALYQLAARLLGPRPARLGECSLAMPEPRDYEHIEPMLTVAEPPRIGAETEVLAKRSTVPSLPHSNAVPRMATSQRLARARTEVLWEPVATSSKPVSFDRRWLGARSGGWGPSKSLGATDAARAPGGDLRGAVGAPARGATDDTLAASVLNQLGPVFCVPVNKTLLARWDRVEDRLWKLHHCLDLDGVRRDLALFAPELDPMSRIEATALELTPDELVSEAANEVPPYRFAYLIERAKGFASSLAGFGGALLGALERRDSEALSILRQQQGLALARLTREQRELDIEMAREGFAALERQVASVEYRRDYYDELVTSGLSLRETREQALRASAQMLRTIEHGHRAAGAYFSAIPQFTPLWDVEFGGVQLAGVANGTAGVIATKAQSLEGDAAAYGQAAGYERRADGWRHQLQLAKDELASMARQRRAAELRVKAAEQSLVAYDESVQQLEDVLQFERDRVTNLALHTRLAQGLKALYRLAYGHALALARLAERAYRYERGDSAGGLMAGYWDASIGGLLAGERLLSDLQALDRRFLETNHRELEIDQPFALSQLDPAALWNLRQNGVCQFTVPEVAFDVTYPGHWKRRLRAVRLTIPCVTGPYVNVGATLTLISSQVRPTPTGALVDVPLAHGTTIATSSAQADGGVFELSFRDERYLPFEGQGAVSTWRLELPSKVRAFDYGSISDVVVSLAYSAKPDATRRGALEGPASIDTSILYHYRNTDTTRIVSLRDELGASFVRLLRSPVATPVAFELTDDMLAPVFRAGPTNIADARIAVRLAKGLTSVGALALRLDGRASEPFAEEPSLGGLQTADVAAVNPLPLWTGPHTLELVAAGDVGGDPDALDPAKVLDILLVTTIRLA